MSILLNRMCNVMYGVIASSLFPLNHDIQFLGYNIMQQNIYEARIKELATKLVRQCLEV